jgi:ABC-type glycerol-3-phosphate transport system substrate-binding protein
MMKRALIAGVGLLAVALASSWAIAADPGIDPSQVTGKITYYTHWTSYITDGLFAKWIGEFKKEYPNADVDVQGITTYAETIATRLSTGDYGDVLDTPASVPPDQLSDFFAPLDDLQLSQDFNYADAWVQDGKPYAYTFGVSVEGMVYNKAAFKKAGIAEVPKTYTDFIADCKKLKDAGIIPVVANMGSAWPLSVYDGLALAISGDANFLNDMVKDPTPFAADKPYGKSLGILHQLITEKLTEPDLTTDHWEDSKGWMASGKAAMWFLGNWSINQIIQEGSTKAGVSPDADNIGFFPLPYDDSGKFNVNSGHDYGLSVAKNSQNLPTAKAWLEFLLTKTDISQIAGFIPGDKRLQPTLPQLTEFQSYKPNILAQPALSAAYVNATNLINFTGGHGEQSLMNADDYKAAIDKLNKDWADAASRSQ